MNEMKYYKIKYPDNGVCCVRVNFQNKQVEAMTPKAAEGYLADKSIKWEEVTEEDFKKLLK